MPFEILCDTVITEEAEEEEAEAPKQGFQKEICCVCPTKDLIALTGQNGSKVLVHRFVGKLDTLLDIPAPQAPITSLTWRTDGLVIASGHSDGTVNLYDPETGNSYPSIPMESQTNPIISLLWRAVELPNGNSHSVGYLNPIGEFPFMKNSLDILFCLDSSCSLYLLSSGIFPLQRIDCSNEGSLMPLNISISRNVEICMVIGREKQKEHETKLDCVLCDLKNDLFNPNNQKERIWNISRGIHRANSTAERIQGIVTAARSKWRRAQDQINKRRNSLKQMLTDQAIQREPEDDFISFLTTGKPSPAMEQFLQSDKKLMIKPLENSLESAIFSLEIEMPFALKELSGHAISVQSILHGEGKDKFAEIVKRNQVLENIRDSLSTKTQSFFALLSKQFQWLLKLPNDIAESLNTDIETSPHKWPDVYESASIAISIKSASIFVSEISKLWDELSNLTTELLDLTSLELSMTLIREIPVITKTVLTLPTIDITKSPFISIESESLIATIGKNLFSLAFSNPTNRPSSSLPIVMPPKTIRELSTISAKLSQNQSREFSFEHTTLQFSEEGMKNIISFGFYKENKIVILSKSSQITSLFRLSVFSNDGAIEEAFSDEIPNTAREISIGKERGICVIHCCDKRVVIYDLETPQEISS